MISKKKRGIKLKEEQSIMPRQGWNSMEKEEAPPIGGREPLQEDKMANVTGPQGDKEALMIKSPKEMGMVAQVIMVIQMGVEVQVKMENHPEKGKNLLEEIENQAEEMGDQTPVMMMGVGMGPPLPYQILHHLEGGGIGGPDLFMWYRDLQDHQVRWDSLDKLVEMKEMGKPQR